jgi:hypothetical protein
MLQKMQMQMHAAPRSARFISLARQRGAPCGTEYYRLAALLLTQCPATSTHFCPTGHLDQDMCAGGAKDVRKSNSAVLLFCFFLNNEPISIPDDCFFCLGRGGLC